MSELKSRAINLMSVHFIRPAYSHVSHVF
jgi:hypothetical protein